MSEKTISRSGEAVGRDASVLSKEEHQRLKDKAFVVELEDRLEELIKKENPGVSALLLGISKLVSEALGDGDDSEKMLKRAEDIKKAVRSGFADAMGNLVDSFRDGNTDSARKLRDLARVVEVVKFE